MAVAGGCYHRQLLVLQPDRRHQEVDRPGVCQVIEGSGEQGKLEEMVAKSSVVPKQPSQLRDR